MRYIVIKLGLKRDPNFIYKEKSYPYEIDSYNVTLSALKERIK